MIIDEKIRHDEKNALLLPKSFILENNKVKDKYFNVIDDFSPEVFRIEIYNDFVYVDDNESLYIKINEIETDVFEVDFCVGNKNRFSVLELLVLLLIEYMEDGFQLVYYDETTTKKLNVVKDSLDKYIKENTEDIECYGCVIFDVLVVESNSALDTKDAEEHETSWLREGLLFKIKEK